jgi:orotate phosphoribosyltransferase
VLARQVTYRTKWARKELTRHGAKAASGSAMIAVNEAKAMGANVVMVLSDREEGAREFYRERNIKFDALFSAGDFLKS